MNATQLKHFNVLVDGFWSGEISEKEFVQGAKDLGASLDRISRTLDEVRSEDFGIILTQDGAF